MSHAQKASTIHLVKRKAPLHARLVPADPPWHADPAYEFIPNTCGQCPPCRAARAENPQVDVCFVRVSDFEALPTTIEPNELGYWMDWLEVCYEFIHAFYQVVLPSRRTKKLATTSSR